MAQRLTCTYLTESTLKKNKTTTTTKKTENVARDLEEKKIEKLHGTRGFLLKERTDVSNMSQVMILVDELPQ